MRFTKYLAFLFFFSLAACGESQTSPGESEIPKVDPGTAPWERVAPERVAAECGLDPELLAEADEKLNAPYAVVRYGKLCHEYYPEGKDEMQEVFSATKTFGALVTGMVAWETRDLQRNGRKTGPLSANDRVDHWLDEFTFNQDAKVEHVLGMVGFNEDLNYPNRTFEYDAVGTREINRLSDILNTAIAQDPERLGANLEEFTQKFVFDRLGMTNSSWSGEIFGVSWASTVHDMARVGLVMMNGGEWNGERIVSKDWIYRMIHPSFEDTNPGVADYLVASYGYLTWLSTRANRGMFGRCSPPSLWNEYPHGETSQAPNCGYPEGVSCEQEFDAGAWSAWGFLGQYISAQPGLNLVLTGKYMGDELLPGGFWDAVRPALVALDPIYAGDEEAFCSAYAEGAYAPDLQN